MSDRNPFTEMAAENRALTARVTELEAALKRHYAADQALYEMPFDCDAATDIAAIEEHDASYKAIAALLAKGE